MTIGHRKGEPIPFINGHNRRITERYRIQDRGYKTPCWIWMLGKNIWGYGVAHNPIGSRQAHRVVYEEHRGEIGKLHLDHLCRNKDCVNPDHLEPVEHAVNIQRGSLAKLTPSDVIEIRELLSQGLKQKEIAQRYDVHQGTISAIKCEQTWTNV
jgi:hypothetical protein